VDKYGGRRSKSSASKVKPWCFVTCSFLDYCGLIKYYVWPVCLTVTYCINTTAMVHIKFYYLVLKSYEWKCSIWNGFKKKPKYAFVLWEYNCYICEVCVWDFVNLQNSWLQIKIQRWGETKIIFLETLHLRRVITFWHNFFEHISVPYMERVFGKNNQGNFACRSSVCTERDCWVWCVYELKEECTTPLNVTCRNLILISVHRNEMYGP